MIYIGFILLAAVTVLGAIKLSEYAEVIQQKTAMTGFFAGAVLIAGATSLPEVTTSVTAGLIRSPDLAVGNVLGSNLFNLFVLACADLWFRKKQMYVHVSGKSFMPGLLGLLLTAIVAVSFLMQTSTSVFGIGIDSLLIFLLYFGGLFYLNKQDKLPDEPVAKKEVKLSLKAGIIRFAIAALIIMAAGSYLTILGDEIAVETGLGQSFVGSLLIAGATSLPEVSIIYLALKRDQFNAALGVILGSNMFNLILLAIADGFYLDATLLRDAGQINWISIVALLLLTSIVLLATWRNKSMRKLTWLPSLLVVIVYVATMTLLYLYGSV
ncbi:cation antiporter [Bacillus sp. JCM 19045]|nr:cation antiporter [Bacillus sp. JCM 19045]